MNDKANKLFLDNQALVTYVLTNIVKNWPSHTRQFHYEDMSQSGLIGLWKACMKFDESKGYEFATFAVPAIRNEIYMYVRKNIQKAPDTISLETPMGDEGLTLADMIEGKSVYDICWVTTDNRLDSRQKTVCEYLAQGYTNTKIAKIIGVSQPHVSKIIKKIGEILKEDV